MPTIPVPASPTEAFEILSFLKWFVPPSSGPATRVVPANYPGGYEALANQAGGSTALAVATFLRQRREYWRNTLNLTLFLGVDDDDNAAHHRLAISRGYRLLPA